MTNNGGRARVAVLAVLLAACAGSVDVFAFFALGKAFASIVTGNLVTAGYGVATANIALIKSNITAVAGFVAGGITWARLLRLPGAALPLLLGELAILIAVAVAWLAAGGHPDGIVALILLAAASIAMGGQSIWALRIHETTTYFTGLVTQAISAASAGSADALRVGARQLAALLAGAILSGVTLSQLRPAAPAVPVALLAAALAVHMAIARSGGPRPAGAGTRSPGT